ncbi:MAG: heat-inducible transcriptional repressor HrcA [Ignavibacteria bacterium]|nr:heat-inducible transcriptional repressor HrcA [Ignavibacteria bacterium]
MKDREKIVLRAVVQLYINTATPVGSRLVSKYLSKSLNLSSATIRNIMSELEGMDLLAQTHISSGRIPTDKGYRIYIDNLIPHRQLSEREVKKLEEEFRRCEPTTIEDVLKIASRVLGLISKYLSIVVIPEIQNIIVEKFQIFQLYANRLFFVLVFNSNIIQTLTIETDFEIKEQQIQSVIEYINSRISGKPLRYIYENFRNLVAEHEEKDSPLLQLVVTVFDKFYSNIVEQEKTFIAGTKNLLRHPEFSNPENVKKVILLLEETGKITQVLKKFDDGMQTTKILIGKETESELFYDYSIVASPYWLNNAVGYIGLLGPKRMHYSKVISLVEYTSKFIEKNFSRFV